MRGGRATDVGRGCVGAAAVVVAFLLASALLVTARVIRPRAVVPCWLLEREYLSLLCYRTMCSCQQPYASRWSPSFPRLRFSQAIFTLRKGCLHCLNEWSLHVERVFALLERVEPACTLKQ